MHREVSKGKISEESDEVGGCHVERMDEATHPGVQDAKRTCS